MNHRPKAPEQTTVIVDCLCNPRQTIDIGTLLVGVKKITCRIDADLKRANIWRIQVSRDRVADLLKAVGCMKNVKVVEG